MSDAREPAVWCEPVEALRDTGPGAFRLNRAERPRAPLQALPLVMRGGLSADRATGGGIRVVTRFHVPDFFGSQGLFMCNNTI